MLSQSCLIYGVALFNKYVGNFILLRSNKKNYFLIFGCALLSGCSLHTINPFPKTAVESPQAYSIIIENPEFQSPWWEGFDRPLLNNLVAQSLSQNFDIAQSVAILNQSRALARQTGSQAMPQIDLEGDASRNWRESDGQRGTSEIGASLSWDVDIWNRIGSAAKADRLEAQARLEDVDTIKLLTSTQIANAYFGAVASRQTIDLLKDQLKLDRELQQLLQLRLNEGIGTNVEVLQQRARVADSETLIPLAEADLSVFENRLDVLLGTMPDAQNRIPDDETLQFVDDMPSIGVPAALLLNRPDLRAARAELVAADADIASAIADRLPNVMLNGSYVFSDTQNFTGPVGMIMGTFIQPLLDWGQRKAEVERNKALYQERLAAYTQLYLEAVEGVENALIREIKQREFLKKLSAQKNILQRTVNAAKDRYTQGVDDYLPVIDALKELRSVERDLITEQLNLVTIRIDLFRAIGGPIYAQPQKDMSNDIL